jgi:hypothetical protein
MADSLEAEDDEKGNLVALLDRLRDSVVRKLNEVPDEAARRQLVASGTSLYWLALHLTAVEINQFQRILDGRSVDHFVPPPPGDDDTLVAAVTRYQVACGESRAIVASFPHLGAMSREVGKAGTRRSVRWVLAHAIEETARHAGHLDILREQLDGSIR